MDFRQLYAGGYLMRNDSTNLYDFENQKAVQNGLISNSEGFIPYNHPPYEALLFWLLSYLPYTAAYFCFASLNLILLVICFLIGRPALSRQGGIAQPKPGLQIFVFLPVVMAIVQGQDSIILLLGLCSVYRCLLSERRFAAGIVLGLLMFKLQVVLPLAVFLVAHFGFSLLAGFASGSLLVGAVSVAAVGWNTFLSFGRVLVLTGSVSFAKDAPYGILGVVPLAMPNLRGLLYGTAAGLFSRWTIFYVTFAASVVLALWVMRLLKRRNLTKELAFSLSTGGAVLLSYHLNVSDLTVMLLPLGILAGEDNVNLSRATWLFYCASPLLFIVGVNTLFLLSLPLMMFLLGITQVADREWRAATIAETSSA